MAVCGAAFAQVVNIPDPALERLIRQKLRIRSDRPITQDDIRNLRGDLDAGGNIGITDITGLEYATNLSTLSLYHNPIIDISPMSGMTGLTGFNLWGCQIEDLTPLRHLPNLTGAILGNNRVTNLEPLSGLTNITFLDMDSNRISDVRPLSTLHNLVHLELDGNQIVDYSPLANLTNLQVLWIQNNPGDDFSPLNALSLSEFRYDQKCDFPPESPSIEERLKTRSMPSIFQAWNNTSDLKNLTWDERNELHDLHWSQSFNLDWDTTVFEPSFGLATSVAGSLDVARKLREEKLSRNPNMIFLVEIRMRDHLNEAAFPPDSPFWLRNTNGSIVQFGPSLMFNFLLPEVQQLLIDRILAIEKCGYYDGVLLDGFNHNGTGFAGRHLYEATDEEIIQAYTNIFEVVRAQVRDDFLILINANQSKPTRFAKYLNGVFMESGKDHPGGYTRDWIRVHEDVLTWAESNLRQPRINCFYGEGMSIEPPDGPNNLRWMRMFTTLSLTHSDGYVLYTDGQRDFAVGLEIPHHAHVWYDFWNTDLGQPVGPKATFYDPGIPGVFIREFTNGWAVYNRSGKAQVIEFPENVSSVTSGLAVANHTVLDLDGDMFLKVETKNPADVNGDGIVNILDLILVAQGIGTGELTADVNGDGVVNVFDLVFVANQF
jgi:hypothetical protein